MSTNAPRAAQRTTQKSTAKSAPTTAPSTAPNVAPRSAPATAPRTVTRAALRAAFCATLFMLTGESARGVGHCADGIKVPAGNPSALRALVDANPPRTRFCLLAGVHEVTSEIVPKEAMIFEGSSAVIRGRGGRAFAGYGGAAPGVTLRGLIFEGFDTAVKTTDTWQILGNTFRNNRVGITVNGQGVHVLNNVIRENSQYGITASGANQARIEGNEIAHNNLRGSPWDGDAGASKFIRSDGLTLRGNWVHHNMGNGLWSDGNVIRVLYESNLVEHNTGVGIFHELGHDAVIRGNTLRSNALGVWEGAARSLWWGANIHLANSQGVQVYHNTVDMGAQGNGIGIVHSAQRESTSSWYGVYESRNIRVYRNHITSARVTGEDAPTKRGTAAGFIWQGGAHEAHEAQSRHIVFENNRYHDIAEGVRAWAWGDGVQLNWTQWQAGSADANAPRPAQDAGGMAR